MTPQPKLEHINLWHASALDKAEVSRLTCMWRTQEQDTMEANLYNRPMFLQKGRKEQCIKSKVEKTDRSHHRRQSGNNKRHQSRAGTAIENNQETQEVKLIDTGLQKPTRKSHMQLCVPDV